MINFIQNIRLCWVYKIYSTRCVNVMCWRHVDVWSYLVIIQYTNRPQHGHTKVTPSWSWMTDSHPFHFMSIGPPIPEIRLFQMLTMKIQCQGQDSKVERANMHSWPSIQLICFFFHFTSIRPTIPEIKLFQNLTLKYPRSRSWAWSKVKITQLTHYPINC